MNVKVMKGAKESPMIGKWNLEKLSIEKLLLEHKDAIERQDLAITHAYAIEQELNSRGYYFTPRTLPTRRLYDKCTCHEVIGDDMACPHHGKVFS